MKQMRPAGAFGLLMAGVSLFVLSNLLFPAKDMVAGVKEAVGTAVEVPDLIRDYTLEADSRVEPAATVGLVKASTEDVFQIGYNEIEHMVREAVAMAGGLESVISDGNTVVLKPNIVVNNFMGKIIPREANGMVTDWRVVSAVAKMVREVNPSGKILVIEGSASESTMEGYQLLNYTRQYIPEVDEFLGIEDTSGDWLDSTSAELHTVQLPADKALYPDFKVADGSVPYYYNKQYFEADVFISLPVLKNHETAGVTGAIKNMGIGGTPTNIYGNGEDENGRWNIISHDAPKLHKFIHDFYFGRPADFAIMDGIQGYSNGPNWNNGPTNIEGHYEGMGLILASSDPLAMDAIASLLMFHDPTQVPHLVYLNNDDLGCADPMSIRVEGSLVSDVKKPFAHENHKTPCSYTDETAPAVSIDSVVLEDRVLKIILTTDSDLARVDLQVDGQALDQFIIGDYGNIEVDISDFVLTDSLLTLFVHDQFMNTGKLLAKIEAASTLGVNDFGQTFRPTLYPNPAVSSVKVRMNMPNSGLLTTSLYNLSGQLVKEKSVRLEAGPAEIDFSLEGVSSGNYVLHVVSGHKRQALPLVKL